jgi:hypothetical protein
MTRARDLGDFIADGGAPELVVDTTTLVVDSTNNRVGIGTASPSAALDVTGDVSIADKIIHTGDTNTAIRFPAADTVSFETAGSERLRVGSAGQVGIAGANYGTSGQVLTSGGSGSAISWADPTGGGSADFVATGAISNGDVVVLKADGTVGVVATSDSVLNPVALGTPVTFSSVDTARIASVYDPDTGKIVIGYQNSSNNYPYAIVGTVSGTSITFGTAVQIQAVNSGSYMKIVYDTANDKHVFVFAELVSGQEEHGQAVVGTVSGTSISFGSIVEFENSSNPLVTYIDAAYDSANGKVVIVWNNSVVTNRGFAAIVGTVSGNSISFGSRTIMNSTSGTNAWCAYDVNAGKILAGIRYQSATNPSYVGTVSGTSISFGSAVEYSQNASGTKAIYDSNAQKIVIVFVDIDSNQSLASRVATISGTSVTWGNKVTVKSNSGNGDEDIGLAFSNVTNSILISFRDNEDNKYVKVIRGTVSGTTLGSIQSAVSTGVAGAALYGTNALAYDTTNKKFVLLYGDDDNGDIGKAIVVSEITTTTDADNYIGIAEAAISNSATGTITLQGGINESQSSLSIGTDYFVADDGSITTTDTGRRLGEAISTTKILLDFGVRTDLTGGFQSMQVFTSSGTWTKPSGITKVKVTVVGGGGGGAGRDSADDSSMGGGGGGASIEVIDVSSVSSVTVTIGAGGAGGANGSDGGTTSFGSYLQATGGEGGVKTQADPGGGLGGVGSGGDINFTGQKGSGSMVYDNSGNDFAGGMGGNSLLGFGGAFMKYNETAAAATGFGGGGGAKTANSSTTGAAGSAGIVIVEEFS